MYSHKDKEKEKERCRQKYLRGKDFINRRAKERRIEKLKNDHVTLRKAERSNRLQTNYGISIDDYDKIFESQGGVCKICHKPPVVERLCVDHNHSCCPGLKSCGKCIRGLICRRCNSMLGFADDNTDRLRSAIEYLERNKI